MAAAIEQSHDDDGIIWQVPIAPFEVLILPISIADDKIMKVSGELYKKLKKEGIDVVLDDRDEQAGVKFKDADLIGIPLRVTVGAKTLKENNVEIKLRKDKNSFKEKISEAPDKVKELLKNMK